MLPTQVLRKKNRAMTFVKESGHKYPASGACNNDSEPSNFTLDLLSVAQLMLEAVVD